jgi:hypothetical protein
VGRSQRNNRKRKRLREHAAVTAAQQPRPRVPRPPPKAIALAMEALAESKKATYWQRVAIILGLLVAVETAFGIYYAFVANSSSQPQLTAKAALGWVFTSNGVTVAEEISQMPRPMGASDAIIFNITDKGGTGVRIESLTIKYACQRNSRCSHDTFFQTSQVGQPGQLTLPFYLQPNDSASLPVPLACDHGVLFQPAKPTVDVSLDASITITGGKTISAGVLRIPRISGKAVLACRRHVANEHQLGAPG